MSVAAGYAGKILNVDLSTGGITRQPLDMDLARKFIGGMGLAAKILYDEIGPQIDPLSPENIIIFSAGPLAGTEAPCSGRTEVTTKSPLTGTFGSGNAGGYWAPALKSAGYDALIIRGQSSKPVYLYIDDKKVELMDAGTLWGKNACETPASVREKLGEAGSYKTRVASIGPAGENMVKFASITFDCYHSCARSGAGAVMGTKKLKAVAVKLSNKRVPGLKEFRETAREAFMRIVERRHAGASVDRMGSLWAFRNFVEEGSFPNLNYQSGALRNLTMKDVEKIPEYIVSAPAEMVGCHMCPRQCKHMVEVKSGKYAGLRMSSGTFVNTIYTWTKVGIENIQTAWKCKDTCERLGIDQGSGSGTVAFAMELYQRGLIGKEEIGGLDLTWGNDDAVLGMLDMIAHRRGFGNILAEGSAKASAIIGKGSERYVMAVKGMEMLGRDARSGSRLWCFGYATSTRGCYVKSTHVNADCPPIRQIVEQKHGGIENYSKKFVESLDIPEHLKKAMYGDPPIVDKYTWKGKPLMTKWFEDLFSIINCLSSCLFTDLDLGPTHYSKMLSTCAGWKISPEELMMAGERVHNLTKLFGVREGFRRKDDYYPKRFYEDPLPEGPHKGTVVSLQEFDRALDEYYEVRGWDKKTGNPTSEKLAELGLASEGTAAGIH